MAMDFQYFFGVHHYRVQVNKYSLKLNGKHQLLDYAADVTLLSRSVHTRWFKYDGD